MARPSFLTFFRQSLKSESLYSDEIINTYVLRPLAGIIVWLVYPTRVTPNHITITAAVVGFMAAILYTLDTPTAIAVAGLSVTMKDILDDADGQLARAKELYSRRGRFLDSIGDFLVNVTVFSSITWVVYQSHPSLTTILLGVLSLLGITLRVSYHVFYQVSFLHKENRYKLNRLAEGITDEDLKGDRVALRLQSIFLWIYGWQDRMMERIDRWCRAGVPEGKWDGWYSDRTGLRVSGLIGFGTEYAVLTLCSLFNSLYLYLLFNVLLMNGVWAGSILYRKAKLAPELRAAQQ